MLFRDRFDAGSQLAAHLKTIALHDPVVLGIPRGGAVVAAAIAHGLNAELDVVLAHKLRAPLQPELAIGAIDEEGNKILSPLGAYVPQDYVKQEVQHQLNEIERRKKLFRPIRPQAILAGRSVIITDDGIATGSTMFAAIAAVQHHQPRELIVAIPVGPAETIKELRQRCDRVICIASPADFQAVGEFYQEFEATEDAEVVELLRSRPTVAPKS